MGELDTLWLSRYEKRVNWRKRAMKLYIDSLKDEEFKDFITNSLNGTVPVCLYGKSQVGKTTFLLELMGIKRESLETIHTILRCGTKEGAPATPTAMIYKKTQAREFIIHFKSKSIVCNTEEEISNELINIRKSVEEGTFHDLDEIIIEIPERYFEDNQKIDIQVCDLPGVDSSNEKERPHVDRIIKKFIPISALILVFQIGSEINSVSDLFSNEVMSETYGWKYMKKRYRLIVTKSFTADSVVREIAFGDPFTGKNDIIELYRREANKDENNPENVPDDVKIFPFELGKSLKDLPLKYEDETRQRVIQSIMDELWEEIHRDIKFSAESGNVVQRLSEIPGILKRLIETKQIERSNSLKHYNTLIEEKESEINELLRNNQISFEKSEEIKSEIKRLSSIEFIGTFDHYRGELIRDEMLGFIERVKDEFNKRINKVYEQINIEKRMMWKNETNELFTPIKSSLFGIKINKGRLFWGPDSHHKTTINNNINHLNFKVNNEYNVIIRELITKKSAQWENEQHSLEGLIAKNNCRVESLRHDVKDLQFNRDSINDKISQKIENYQSELENDNSFNKYMRNEVQEEKNQIMLELGNKSPVEALLDMAYTSLIIKEYNKQINFS